MKVAEGNGISAAAGIGGNSPDNQLQPFQHAYYRIRVGGHIDGLIAVRGNN
jgi:hypothetical protein